MLLLPEVWKRLTSRANKQLMERLGLQVPIGRKYTYSVISVAQRRESSHLALVTLCFPVFHSPGTEGLKPELLYIYTNSFLIFRNRSFTGQGAPAFSDSSLPVRELSAVGRATFSCFFLFFRSLAAGGATFPVLHGIARLTVEQFAFSRSGRLFGE